MDNTDLCIQRLYQTALFESPAEFRANALKLVCNAMGATAAAWATHNRRNVLGEYTVHPGSVPTSPGELIAAVTVDDEQQQRIGNNLHGESGVAMRYPHTHANLISTVAFWFGGDASPPAGDDFLRPVIHLAEAGAMALQNFIIRDEQLAKMGRPSRGATALVDASGVVYATSRQFRQLVKDEFSVDEFHRLPFTIPDDELGDDGLFSQGNLRFRSSRMGNLFMMHARQPQPIDTLSPREQQIARALGHGKTFKSVAKQCGIAVSTVANHASRIYRKLGIYRREDLVEMVRESHSGDRPAG